TGWLRRQERWHDVPIIAVTAHAREVDRAASLGAGCDDYVAKPFDRDHLRAKIEHLTRTVRPAA
ncbi:MAG: hypothetical protein QOD06_1530, partial [Candidatus Binatota bacterium]|nr:hypothetical protein [Candidatus Binatota bacterium]